MFTLCIYSFHGCFLGGNIWDLFPFLSLAEAGLEIL